MPQVNLLPPEYRRRRRERRVQWLVVLAGTVLVLFLLLVYLLQRAAVSREEDELRDLRRETAALRGRVAQLQQYSQLQQDVETRRGSLATVLAGDVAWSKFLNDLSLIMPDNSWLVNLTSSSATGQAPNGQQSFGTTAFQGFVFDFPGVAGWLTRISQIDGLTFVYLTNGQKQELAGRSVVNFSANSNVTQALLSQRCQAGKPCP